MAHLQQILGGESHVTGSLVAVAVFQIRQGYVEVIECDDTEPSMISLAKVLLTDFATRYAPACSDTGKVISPQRHHLENTSITLAFTSISLLHHVLTPGLLPYLVT